MASRTREKKERQRKRFTEPFGAIPVRVMESEAYMTLGHYERSVLLAVAAGYNGKNNGKIALTFAQARDRYGIRGQNRFYAALKELEKRGLIRRTYAGRLRQFSEKGPSRYLLEWKQLDECPEFNVKEGPATENWTRRTPNQPVAQRKYGSTKKSPPACGDGSSNTVSAPSDGKAETAPADGDGNSRSPYPPVVKLLDISARG